VLHSDNSDGRPQANFLSFTDSLEEGFFSMHTLHFRAIYAFFMADNA